MGRTLEEMIHKYVITAAEVGARPNNKQLDAYETYAEENGAEIVVIPILGQYRDEELAERFNNYRVVRELPLGKTVGIRDFGVKAQQINPLTGLKRFGSVDKSIIVGSTKQHLEHVANSNTHDPKAVLSTGVCTLPNYKEHFRIGKIGLEDHIQGAVLIDVDDETDHFYFRQTQNITDGSFIDNGVKYTGKGATPVRADTMVLGDLHEAQMSQDDYDYSCDMINALKPKYVMLHDAFDAYSINHHDIGRNLLRAGKANLGQLSLYQELYNLGERLHELSSQGEKDTKYMVVKSNHDEALDKYLDECRFVGDSQNLQLSVQLANAMIEGKDPVEEGIKLTYGYIPRNLKFLKRDDEFNRYGYNLSNHGDKGASGGRGSMTTFDYALGKAIIGHCFSEDTEILTKRGWVRGDKLLEDDEVMTMNKETREGEWNSIEAYYEYDDYTEMVSFKSKGTDILVTGGHGMIAEHSSGSLKEFKASEFLHMPGEYKFFNGIIKEGTKKYDDDYLRIIVQIVTDGSYNCGMIRWHLKKKRKINRLVNLLNRLNYSYSVTKAKDNTVRISLKTVDAKEFQKLMPDKTLPSWFMDLSYEEKLVVLEEYAHTDGTDYGSRCQLSSSKKQDIDLLQAIAATCGFRTSLYCREDGNYSLNILFRGYGVLKSSSASVVPYSGKVWCVTVSNGTLLVRRNGKVAVTQNSHTARIRKGVYQVGTLERKDIDYTKGSLGNWTSTNGVLYPNGKVQLVGIYNDKWRL